MTAAWLSMDARRPRVGIRSALALGLAVASVCYGVGSPAGAQAVTTDGGVAVSLVECAPQVAAQVWVVKLGALDTAAECALQVSVGWGAAALLGPAAWVVGLTGDSGVQTNSTTAMLTGVVSQPWCKNSALNGGDPGNQAVSRWIGAAVGSNGGGGAGVYPGLTEAIAACESGVPAAGPAACWFGICSMADGSNWQVGIPQGAIVGAQPSTVSCTSGGGASCVAVMRRLDLPGRHCVQPSTIAVGQTQAGQAAEGDGDFIYQCLNGWSAAGQPGTVERRNLWPTIGYPSPPLASNPASPGSNCVGARPDLMEAYDFGASPPAPTAYGRSLGLSGAPSSTALAVMCETGDLVTGCYFGTCTTTVRDQAAGDKSVAVDTSLSAPPAGPYVPPAPPATGTGTNAGTCDVNIYYSTVAPNEGGFTYACNISADIAPFAATHGIALVHLTGVGGSLIGTALDDYQASDPCWAGYTGQFLPCAPRTVGQAQQVTGGGWGRPFMGGNNAQMTVTDGSLWYVSPNNGGQTTTTVNWPVEKIQLLPTGPMVVPSYPSKYYPGGQPGGAVVPAPSNTPTIAPGQQPTVSTVPVNAPAPAAHGSADPYDWLGSVFTTVGNAITGSINWLGGLFTATITWLGQFIAATWNAIGDVLAGLLQAILNVLVATEALISGILNGITALPALIVSGVGVALQAVVNAIVALPATIATAVATSVTTALQTAVVPSTASIDATKTQLKTAADGTVIGTGVKTGGDLLNGIVNGANSGMGSSCGPSIGFDGQTITVGGLSQSIPGFRIRLPSGPSCPGNGPNGSQTTYDVQAWDLLGFAGLVRGIIAFGIVYVFFWSLIHAAPWRGTSTAVSGPLASQEIPLGVEVSTREYVDGGLVETRNYLRGNAMRRGGD